MNQEDWQVWEKLSETKSLNLKSYINVKTSLDNPLVSTKLHIFRFVASIVEPFLKQFETD